MSQSSDEKEPEPPTPLYITEEAPALSRALTIDSSIVRLPSRASLTNANDQADQDYKQVSSEAALEFPHTIYTRHEIWFLCGLVSLAGFLSSVSTPIYLPVIGTIGDQLHVTVEDMNLTITAYSIFQGISPAVFGGLADRLGRRPIYIISLTFYTGSCIGMALARRYSLLIVMRCIQAFGGASTIALGSGVMADLTTRKERGNFMGIFSGIALVGNAFGPLIGGGIASSLGWRAIFWFLLILSAAVLVVLVLFLPETDRHRTGNGSLLPPKLNRSLYIFIRGQKTGLPSADSLYPLDKSTKKKTSLWASFLIMKEKDVIVMLISLALFYTTWFMAITAQSTLLKQNYNFDENQIGLSYLANGIGALVGSIGSGKVMNWYYAHCVAKYKQAQEAENKEVDMSEFDIYHARLQPGFATGIVYCIAVVIFGWTIEYKVQYVCPIIFTFFLSSCSIATANFVSTLIIDIHYESSAAATGAVNFVRCLLCAAGTACVDKMVVSMGAGGAFTLLSGFCAMGLGLQLLEIKKGRQWDRERREREAKKLENCKKAENIA